VSDPAQRISDALRLVNDAQLDGQLRALRKIRQRLGERAKQLNGLVATASHPAARVKARGEHDAIARVIRELDEEIEAVELERAG
jgi:regulator of protease activity HflC (stomatin/prohibitin superfamily)